MGILFISITAGVVLVAFILIIYLRRNKTINDPAGHGSHGAVEKKTGKDKGICD